MHPFVTWFVSGFGYIALCLISVGMIALVRVIKTKRARHSLTIGAVVVAITASFSGSVTPFPVQMLGWGSLAVGALMVASQPPTRPCSTALGLGVAFLLAGVGYEVRNAFGSRVGPPVSDVVVVGDSLSAGIRPDEVTWPERLSRISGLPVRNLSLPGARIAQGSTLIGSSPLQGATVIILLGGNDMLSGGDVAGFERELRSLVSSVKAKGGNPMLVQFPAFPTKGAYPTTVARVARHENLAFIPRWVLAGVLAKPGSTVDGVHLSEAGHAALAESVSKWIAFDSRQRSD